MMTPDSKSVKRWTTRAPKELFIDRASVEVVEASAYDAVVAEKDAEIAKLKSEHEKWRELDAFLKDDGDVPSSVYESAVKGRRDFRQALKESREELSRLRASESKLVEALKFYAEFANWNLFHQQGGDMGQRAREAIAEWEKGRG